VTVLHSIAVSTSIKLNQFLKLSNAAGSGGQGKMLVQTGRVSVNGTVVYHRGKNILPGDIVSVEGIGAYKAVAPEEA